MSEPTGNYALQAGDRVYVDDPALAQLRAIVNGMTGEEPEPNHHGTIDHIVDGWAYIIFDSDEGEAMGTCAPYSLCQVHPLVRGQR